MRKRSFGKGRRESVREVRPRFLIVCEDKKSAPNYFAGFRLSSAKIHAVGTGMNTLSLVEEAIRIRDDGSYNEVKDQTWVVMDRDSFPKANFDNAFHKAQANGIKICFSNECIEVWFNLHFSDSSARIPRGKLPGVISRFLKRKYEKGMRDIYILLLAYQETAIANAIKLERENGGYHDFAGRHCCPATNAHTLVVEIRKYL